MRTLTIDIINEKALNLLRDMELRKLIRLRTGRTDQRVKADWERYKGCMSKQPLDKVDRQLRELRSEWE